MKTGQNSKISQKPLCFKCEVILSYIVLHLSYLVQTDFKRFLIDELLL